MNDSDCMAKAGSDADAQDKCDSDYDKCKMANQCEVDKKSGLQSRLPKAAAFLNMSRPARVIFVSNPATIDCAALCAKQSPWCSGVPLPTDIAAELDKLRAMVVTAKGTISKPAIMQLFGQTTDACQRGDVDVSRGRFRNVGKGGCAMTVPIEMSAGAPADRLVIGIPEVVSGNLSIANGEIDATIDPQTEPVLTYNNDPNDLFSGPLSRVQTKNGTLIATLGKSCLFIEASKL